MPRRSESFAYERICGVSVTPLDRERVEVMKKGHRGCNPGGPLTGDGHDAAAVSYPP